MPTPAAPATTRRRSTPDMTLLRVPSALLREAGIESASDAVAVIVGNTLQILPKSVGAVGIGMPILISPLGLAGMFNADASSE